jgi:hypothetical protein
MTAPSIAVQSGANDSEFRDDVSCHVGLDAFLFLFGKRIEVD